MIVKTVKNNFFICVINPIYGVTYYSSGNMKYETITKKPIVTLNFILGNDIADELILNDIYVLDIKFEGKIWPTANKDLIKGLLENDIKIRKIIENTPIPHAGCLKKKKKRR